MLLPEKLIQSLFSVPQFDEQSFRQVHTDQNPPVSIRCNPAKKIQDSTHFSLVESVAWCNQGCYLPERPVFTLDPLLHAGAYYVQEASSMFLEQAIKYVLQIKQVRLALDLCAAPGGKSTHLAALLPADSVLVSNEVMAPRVSVLMENLVKWGNINVMVTQNDPADYKKLGTCFDLVVVDAPCSGSGLFRRDPETIAEWSEQAVNLCAQRQQRILADVLPALAPGGFLIYATCSYSPHENEAIVDWLLDWEDLQSHALPYSFEQHGVMVAKSVKHGGVGYRFFPNRVKGEGFFLAVFQKGGQEEGQKKSGKTRKTEREVSLPTGFQDWINPNIPVSFYERKAVYYGMAPRLMEYVAKWMPLLNVRKAGTRIGEEAQGKIIPDHDFALSVLIAKDAIRTLEVTQTIALQFLRRQEVAGWQNLEKGWVLITYNQLPIGWIKCLGNRYNNYYPTQWRIRM